MSSTEGDVLFGAAIHALSMQCASFRLVTISEVPMELLDLFIHYLEDRQTKTPLTLPPRGPTGRLLVQFERFSLIEHHGIDSVALRVLKALEPIKLTVPTFMPEAGEHFSAAVAESSPASRDMTTRMIQALLVPEAASVLDR
ncbi:hypothetical protein H2248_003141 [Termitomyces sp. 'cryptogamus']|nr:hypothetical protein H2248_003141 [Termitomyces sp. 'cryptogamus']